MTKYYTGWIRDTPDHRDFSPFGDGPMKISQRAKRGGESGDPLGSVRDIVGTGQVTNDKVSLRGGFPPIENQLETNSCAANAAVALMEYFERDSTGHYVDHSRLFLYKVSRRLANLVGDIGTTVRATMGGMAIFGVPPEQYWPFDVSRVDDEPPAFCYAFAQSFQALTYFRLDTVGTTNDELLDRVLTTLEAGIPCMFGFTTFPALMHPPDGRIAYPSPVDVTGGGHAVLAVGYDTTMEITHPVTNERTTGAIEIRNSWGSAWGENGYGWLPFKYITNGLAVDWWSLVKSEWVPLKQFGNSQS